MKHFICSRVKLLVAAVLFAGLFAFTGCKPEPTEEEMAGLVRLTANDPIVGKWVSDRGENFTISADGFTSDSYECGPNLYVAKSSDGTSGIIFAKYTKVYDWDKEQSDEPEDTSDWLESWGKWYPLNEALIGKYYAVYYLNFDLEAGSISISGANGTKKAADTITEAVSEFTVANGYFANSSDCVKATD